MFTTSASISMALKSFCRPPLVSKYLYLLCSLGAPIRWHKTRIQRNSTCEGQSLSVYVQTHPHIQWLTPPQNIPQHEFQCQM